MKMPLVPVLLWLAGCAPLLPNVVLTVRCEQRRGATDWTAWLGLGVPIEQAPTPRPEGEQ